MVVVMLSLQDVIAYDAPKRHKLSVHVVSSVKDAENHIIVGDTPPDGTVEPSKLSPIQVGYGKDVILKLFVLCFVRYKKYCYTKYIEMLPQTDLMIFFINVIWNVLVKVLRHHFAIF